MTNYLPEVLRRLIGEYAMVDKPWLIGVKFLYNRQIESAGYVSDCLKPSVFTKHPILKDFYYFMEPTCLDGESLFYTIPAKFERLTGAIGYIYLADGSLVYMIPKKLEKVIRGIGYL